MTLAALRRSLVGRRVVRIDGRDLALDDGTEITAVAFDDGTVFRFRWPTGYDSIDYVGLRVESSEPGTSPGRRRRP